MKIVSSLLLLVVLAACNRASVPAPSQSAAKPTGTLLVTELPTGVQGLELKNGAVAVAADYELVKGAEGSFAIARRSDGEHVLSGGCGCTGGTCDPTLTPDGIIVCAGTDCTGSCGLRVIVAGASTDLVKF